MKVKVVITVVLFTIFAVAAIPGENKCACPSESIHLQNDICNLDFVIKGENKDDIKQRTEEAVAQNGKFRKEYSFKVKRVYKFPKNVPSLSENELIKINYQSDYKECAQYLDGGVRETMYMLAGKIIDGEYVIEHCSDIARPWEYLTQSYRTQVLYLSSNLYDDNCQCQVQLCGGTCKASSQYCGFPGMKYQTCYNSLSYCKKDENGFCVWKDIDGMDVCLMNIERN